jgi:hypothetical protein
MGLYVKKDPSQDVSVKWPKVTKIYVKKALTGTWATVTKAYVKVSQVAWSQFWPSALNPENDVTLTYAYGSDNLITLTGTNYHWPVGATLTYDILCSSDGNSWISIFTRNAPNRSVGPQTISNPASKSQNTITYKILKNDALILPDLNNYFAFIVYANTTDEYGTSLSSNVVIQGPGTPSLGNITHDASGTHIQITASNDLSFAIFGSGTAGGENTFGTPYSTINGKNITLTSLVNLSYIVVIGYTGSNGTGYPSYTSNEVYTKSGLKPSAPVISNLVKSYQDYSLRVSFDTSNTDYVIYQDNLNTSVKITTTPYTYGTPKGGEFVAGSNVSYTATSYNASYGAGDSTTGSFTLDNFPNADYTISFSNILEDSYTVNITFGANTSQVIFYDNSVGDSYTVTSSRSFNMPSRGNAYNRSNPGPTVNWSAVSSGLQALSVTKSGSFQLLSYTPPNADFAISFSNITTTNYTVSVSMGAYTNQVVYYENNDSYVFTSSGSTTMPSRGHEYNPGNPGPTVSWTAVGSGPASLSVTKNGSFQLTAFIAPTPNAPTLTTTAVYQDSFLVTCLFDNTTYYVNWSTSAGTSGTSYSSPFTIDNGRNLGIPGGTWNVSATAVNVYGKTASASLNGNYLISYPSNLTAPSIGTYSTVVYVANNGSWSNGPITSYRYQWYSVNDRGATSPVGGNSSSYNYGVNSGNTYYVLVWASNASGESTYASISNSIIPAAPTTTTTTTTTTAAPTPTPAPAPAPMPSSNPPGRYTPAPTPTPAPAPTPTPAPAPAPMPSSNPPGRYTPAPAPAPTPTPAPAPTPTPAPAPAPMPSSNPPSRY